MSDAYGYLMDGLEAKREDKLAAALTGVVRVRKDDSPSEWTPRRPDCFAHGDWTCLSDCCRLSWRRGRNTARPPHVHQRRRTRMVTDTSPALMTGTDGRGAEGSVHRLSVRRPSTVSVHNLV